MGHRAHEDVSIGRISRLLRPLRNRCNALALRQSSPGHIATYSKKFDAQVRASEAPPLSLLRRPDKVPVLQQVDNAFIENCDLARRIYAVVDAYKDIVQKTMAIHKSSSPGQRLPSLAALCATVVGNDLELNSKDCSDSESDEDHDELAAMNSLYQEVPCQYRRYTLLAHATSIVLDTCPHHPSLLLVLFDVALTGALTCDAQSILRALLAVALSPRPGTLPHICHPAHAHFLISLMETWTSGGQTRSCFLRILRDALATAASTEIWDSKAMNRFMEEICRDDPLALVDVILISTQRFLPLGNSTDLRSTLARWWRHVFHVAFRRRGQHSNDLFHALLPSMIASRVGDFHGSRGTMNIEIIDIIICILTCLSTTSDPSPALDWMQGVHPTQTTFTLLVSAVFTSTNNSLEQCREEISTFATLLAQRQLFRLERALLISALKLVDDGLLQNRDPKSVSDYRLELIDLGEDAERRAFGSESGEYAWEPSVQAWIKQAPHPRQSKRVKLSFPHSQTRSVSGRCQRALENECRWAGRDDDDDYPLTPRPTRSFGSIISDALVNRVILHPERRSQSRPRKKADIPEDECPAVIPSSDDLLDLLS